MDTHKIHRPYILRNPPKREIYFPYGETDFEEFKAKMAVYSPFDEDRIEELELWLDTPEAQRTSALDHPVGPSEDINSIPKPPLEVKFPRQYPGAPPSDE